MKKYSAVYRPLVERLQAEAEKSHKKSPEIIKAVKTKLHQLYGAYTQDNAHKKAAAIISTLEAETNLHILCPSLDLSRNATAPSLRGAERRSNPGSSYKKPLDCFANARKDGGPAGQHSSAPDLRQLSEAKTAATALLSLHASTKERLPHYTQFYQFIISHTGPVETILDIGCGYNPFAIPFIQDGAFPHSISEPREAHPPSARSGLKSYHAYDIDIKTAALINRFFTCLRLPPLASCADLAVQTPSHQADLALMCKLIPVLEAQAPGSGFKLARELNARYLLITYPLKSLGGREKGMAKHYTANFEKAMAAGELGKFSLTAQTQAGDEILYLLINGALPLSHICCANAFA